MEQVAERLRELFKKKWILLLVGVFLLIFVLLLLLSPSSKQDSKKVSEKLPQLTRIPTPNQQIPDWWAKTVIVETAKQPPPTPNPTIVEEQRVADEYVGKREVEIRTNFPWFIKLPLRGEKYFVYFETNKKVFVGLLYPKAGDNIDQMKTEIIQKLKDVYGVPTENYNFDWKITPE